MYNVTIIFNLYISVHCTAYSAVRKHSTPSQICLVQAVHSAVFSVEKACEFCLIKHR